MEVETAVLDGAVGERWRLGIAGFASLDVLELVELGALHRQSNARVECRGLHVGVEAISIEMSVTAKPRDGAPSDAPEEVLGRNVLGHGTIGTGRGRARSCRAEHGGPGAHP